MFWMKSRPLYELIESNGFFAIRDRRGRLFCFERSHYEYGTFCSTRVSDDRLWVQGRSVAERHLDRLLAVSR